MHVTTPRFAALLTILFLAACARPLPKYEKPMARAQFQTVRTTAYTHTESDHLEHGRQTCMGTPLRYGAVRSAAADWSRWPAGTQFRILSTGEIYEVEDIGWALSGRNTIDLYKPSKSAMNAWGVRTVDIEILRWGEDSDSLSFLEKRRRHRHVQRMVAGLEDRLRRGATNPAPAAVPEPVPAIAAVSAPAPVVPAQASSGPVLRAFRPSAQ